jgi:hypothetical protein
VSTINARYIENLNIYEQPELPYEKRDQRVTCVFTESEKETLEKRMARHGFRELSVYIRHLVSVGARYEKFENLTLSEILQQKIL